MTTSATPGWAETNGRAGFFRRIRGELLYAVTSLPIVIAGFTYTIVTVGAGIGTGPIGLGLLFLATMVPAARGWAAFERGRAAHHLGLEVRDPGPMRRRPGASGWLRSGLGDVVGWRALLYLFLRLPTAILSFVFAITCYVGGFGSLLYPLWFRTAGSYAHADGVTRPLLAVELFPGVWLDTVPKSLVGSASGLLLLILAPWVVRSVITVDRLLVWGLLGPTAASERVADLETSRSHAVEDSAVTLRRIERDLHDGAQARLVTVTMDLGQARETLRSPNPSEEAVRRAAETVDYAHRNAKQALVELRDLARGIHPPVLDSGLEPALSSLASASAIPVDLRVELPRRPDPAIETIGYFCVAELLTNVAKHSAATAAVVEASSDGRRVLLRVRDNGTGGAVQEGDSGIAGLLDRVRTVDGELTVDSPRGGPTVITIDLPVRA
ncbi:signal transduction histidine kinase [Saccharopolyspora lacisalsi]|uniref:histidine kinase n=1 Tax=Halosaccharopolyspora lacisalsi TaxID=1000566 RepID=A0A839E2Q3_9PSEU|nr:sensor domain-containing protein [Halosaccharopolyspora lacisalsi]MBA8826025.1 signal transduction histidine kinase [Halosaccharopolyspora lacisalsi]